MLTAAIQFNIKPDDIDGNLSYVRSALRRVSDRGCRLAVLPEMWSSGFTGGNLGEAALRTAEIVGELRELSRTSGLVIVGSMPEPDGDRIFNTVHVIDNGRLAGVYRKMHLFSPFGEDRYFAAGNGWTLADTSAGRIGVIICYDLRFPELSRRLALEGAEVICVPAHWPKPRDKQWRILLLARAIENQLFVVSANTCGSIGKYEFFGMSMIVGPRGEPLAEGGDGESEIMADLNMPDIEACRNLIPCFRDRRPELY